MSDLSIQRGINGVLSTLGQAAMAHTYRKEQEKNRALAQEAAKKKQEEADKKEQENRAAKLAKAEKEAQAEYDKKNAEKIKAANKQAKYYERETAERQRERDKARADAAKKEEQARREARQDARNKVLDAQRDRAEANKEEGHAIQREKLEAGAAEREARANKDNAQAAVLNAQATEMTAATGANTPELRQKAIEANIEHTNADTENKRSMAAARNKKMTDASPEVQAAKHAEDIAANMQKYLQEKYQQTTNSTGMLRQTIKDGNFERLVPQELNVQHGEKLVGGGRDFFADEDDGV